MSFLVLILDQLGHDLKQGVKAHPTLHLLDDDNDPTENMKTPSKTPTPGKPPRGSSAKKSQQPAMSVSVPTVASTGLLEDFQLLDDHVNELLPRCLQLDDDEHCFATGFPAVYGHTKKNRRFVFRMDEYGTWWIDMNVIVPEELRTVEGLLDGYDGVEEGSQWWKFVQMALKRLFGGRLPSPSNSDVVWKTMFSLELPYECEKKFYKTTKGGKLVETKAPTLQSNGSFGWFSCWLNRLHLEESKQDGKEVEGLGKGAEFLKKMEGLAICKCHRIVCLLGDCCPTPLIVVFFKEAPTSSFSSSMRMSDISEQDDESLNVDETEYDAADELAALEEEAMEAVFATPQQEATEDQTTMLVEDCVSALKRTRDEIESVMDGDGSFNPEVARRLFQDNLEDADGLRSPGGYTGIGPVPLPDDIDPEL